MKRWMLPMLLVMLCAACGAGSHVDDSDRYHPCDPRDPRRVSLEEYAETIDRSLALTQSLASQVGECADAPEVGGKDEQSIIEACRTSVGEPCVWQCTIDGVRGLAYRRMAKALQFVEAMPERLEAHPECGKLLNSGGAPLWTCLAVEPTDVDGYRIKFDAQRTGGKWAVNRMALTHQIHAGLWMSVVGERESGGCGTDDVWSTFVEER